MPPKQDLFEIRSRGTFPAVFPRLAGDFTSFNRLFNPDDFVAILSSGRQREQLWRPGTTFEQIPPGDAHTLPMLFQELFPGRNDFGSWTPPELTFIQATTFVQVFRTLMPNVPPVLDPATFCNFMVWTTMPLVTFERKMDTLFRAGTFTLASADIFWGERTLNFSFSPRSAYLLYTFGFSIMERSGLTFPQLLPGIVTVGFRLTATRWQNFLDTGKCWNRRYIDYFVALQNTSITFSAQDDADKCTLQSMVVLHHRMQQYTLVQALNQLFDHPQGPFSRLFHVPIHNTFWNVVMRVQQWDFIPRQVLQGTLRARL